MSPNKVVCSILLYNAVMFISPSLYTTLFPSPSSVFVLFVPHVSLLR